jgi:hypothetical protein
MSEPCERMTDLQVMRLQATPKRVKDYIKSCHDQMDLLTGNHRNHHIDIPALTHLLFSVLLHRGIKFNCRRTWYRPCDGIVLENDDFCLLLRR